MAGGWWLVAVAGGWWLVAWLVAGGWWLVAGGWWLVAGGWWLVAGGWWLVFWWLVAGARFPGVSPRATQVRGSAKPHAKTDYLEEEISLLSDHSRLATSH